MRYYVTGEDGNRYGPADEALLRAWASQGRITPNSLLQPESGTGPSIAAGAMPGLQFPPSVTPYGQAPTPYANPYQAGYPQPFLTRSAALSWEQQATWGLAVLGAICMLCCQAGQFFAGAGIVVGIIGLMRGKRTGAPLLLCVAVIVFY